MSYSSEWILIGAISPSILIYLRLKEKENKIKMLTYNDSLTGLFNMKFSWIILGL